MSKIVNSDEVEIENLKEKWQNIYKYIQFLDREKRKDAYERLFLLLNMGFYEEITLKE